MIMVEKDEDGKRSDVSRTQVQGKEMLKKKLNKVSLTIFTRR